MVRPFRRRRHFHREVRRLINELVPGAGYDEVDADTIHVGSLIIGLTNLRAKWDLLDPEDRLPWLREALPALVSPPAIPRRLESTRDLRPGLRPRSMLEAARLANLNGEVNPERIPNRPLIPFQPFGGDLVSVLLWDAPNTMSVVDQAQLDEWRARFADLLPVAIDNLADQPDAGWTVIKNRVWVSLNEDDYDGARMLIPGHLDKTGLAGELVVIHPNRSMLAVTAVDDAKGIRRACELVLETLRDPSPVSFQPLVGRGDDWRPLVLPPSHPGHEAWQRLICVNDQMIHNSLRQPLQALLGDDLFVAGFEVGESSEGTYCSVTNWTEWQPSLLPRTDLICLVTERGEAITAPWDAVHRLVGPLMEPTDHYPELWRVETFPSTSELSKLRNLSSS